MTTNESPEPTLSRTKRSLRVDPALSPGWVAGTERVPDPGERIHTHEGTGVVVRILHKTADGGRVLEVSMDDGRKPPFFAATANVRVRPVGPEDTGGGDGVAPL